MSPYPSSLSSSSSSSSVTNWFVFIFYRLLRYTLSLLALLTIPFNPSKRGRVPHITEDEAIILLQPAIELSRSIKSGKLTSEQVVQTYIGRIKRINPLLNAVVNQDLFESALDRAREIDQQLSRLRARVWTKNSSLLELPLLGVPVSVKETIAIEGRAQTGGLLARRGAIATKDANSVRRLREFGGLIPVAQTNVPEMGLWWDSSNLVYGRTNNPHDLARIPGGSSGGEGALIAAAGSVVGIGSDIAGSIRIPCNFTGIFGHKPTPFLVSNEGSYPRVHGEREKLLATGPMARYACDLLPMLKVMLNENNEEKSSLLKIDDQVDLRQIRVFYLDHIGDPLTAATRPEILTAIRNAADHIANFSDGRPQRVTFDEFSNGMFLWSAEAQGEPDDPTVASQFAEGRTGDLKPLRELVKKIFGLSDHTLGAIISTLLVSFAPKPNSKRLKMLRDKAETLRAKFNEILGEDGILLMPTHPEPAPNHQETFFKIFNISYTSVTSVLQCPATQCPLGLTSEGLPFGVQILAKPLNDRLTIAVAEELERAYGGWLRPCEIEAS